MTVGVPVRVPSRQRFGGVRPGDSATLLGLFAVGVAVQAFFRLPSLRSFLFGQSTADVQAILGLLFICGALMWRALLRRGFVWAEPAMLTWLDFAGADRSQVIGRRMWAVWCVGVGLFVYVGALTGVAAGVGGEVWLATAAVLLGSAAVSLSTARRPPVRGEEFGPVLLASLGLLVAQARLDPLALELLAVALFALGAVRWRAADTVLRSGRKELVDGWNERLVRTVSLTFLDPLALLPAARPVRFSLRRPTALRFAWLGASGRELWLANLGVMLVLAAGWGVVLMAAGLVLGDPPSHAALLTLPIVAVSAVRTATRPPTSFDNLGIVTSRVLGQIPTRLVAQLLRGPDLLIVAALLLAVLTRNGDVL